MNENATFDDGPEFQEWHLTALALGELSPELAASTQRRIDNDPQLALQYSEIQSTLKLLTRELQGSNEPKNLDSARREEVMAHIRSVAPSVPSGPVVRPAADEASRWRRWRIAGAAGLAALAASVILMLQWTGVPNTDLPSEGPLSWKEASRATGEIASSPSPSLAAPRIDEPERIAGRSPTTESMARAATADGTVPAEPAAPKPTITAPATAPGLAMGRSELRGGAGGLGGGGSRGADMSADKAKESLERRALSKAAGSVPTDAIERDVQLGMETRGAGIEEEVLFEELFIVGESNGAEFREKASNSLPSTLQIPDELRANVPSLNRKSSGTGDRFDVIPETPFVDVAQQPLSTFSIDVDTASYSKLRQYVLEQHTLPSPETIRIEEWINYFDYAYPGPADDSPFAAHMRLAPCPWNPDHKLVRVAIAAKKFNIEQRPRSNLVFLIDVSGSMNDSNKLPLVKRTLQLLVSQLREEDQVAIVVYAGAAGCVLPSTSGANKDAILASINELQSGGSTNGGQGIQLAYRIAKEHFIAGGINRVVLCTDGDFNVGVTGTDQLVAMMRENAQSNIFLTCLGYGIGNYNDSMMEQVSNQGNGIYAMVDSELEAKRVMVEQLSGTLMTVAKDVKLQIEFNPARVSSYRLIGYENRRLAPKDFADDRKDAGEIGAGHRVTALYEVVPAGATGSSPGALELRYANRRQTDAAKARADEVPVEFAQEWLYLKIRAKKPEATQSTLQTFTLGDTDEDSYREDRSDMDWASSVAEFGLLMRRSGLAAGADWDRMLSRAMESAGTDPYRRECLLIMQQSRRWMGR
jgi:Ca-activated chloride channel family protein